MPAPPRPSLYKAPKPPQHLELRTRDWFKHVCASVELDEHHVRLLTLAAEAWDRGVQAREAIAEHGLTFTDRFGAPKTRPEVAIERDSRLGFARMLRELDLDVAPPGGDGQANRPPALKSNRRA